MRYGGSWGCKRPLISVGLEYTYLANSKGDVLRVLLRSVILVCELAFIALSVKVATAQQPSMKDKPGVHLDSSKSGPVDPLSFFPFSVGTAWTYKFCSDTEKGSGKSARIESRCGQYTETVVSAQFTSSTVRLIEIRRDGVGPSYTFCEDDEKQPSVLHFWFVAKRLSVYASCDKEKATHLAASLTETFTHNVPIKGPEYLLPFHPGGFWGADLAQPRRADKHYQWNVEAKLPIAIPAGNFKDCYELDYLTGPDDEERCVCAGVGLVIDEYTHHGWVNHYRAELLSFTSGPKIESKELGGAGPIIHK